MLEVIVLTDPYAIAFAEETIQRQVDESLAFIKNAGATSAEGFYRSGNNPKGLDDEADRY